MIIQRTKVVQMSGITKQKAYFFVFYSRMQPTLLKGSANEWNNKTKSQNFVFYSRTERTAKTIRAF